MFEPIDYNELMAARPEVLLNWNGRDYVQNPFFSTKPIIEVDRQRKTAKETRWLTIEDMMFEM